MSDVPGRSELLFGYDAFEDFVPRDQRILVGALVDEVELRRSFRDVMRYVPPVHTKNEEDDNADGTGLIQQLEWRSRAESIPADSGEGTIRVEAFTGIKIEATAEMVVRSIASRLTTFTPPGSRKVHGRDVDQRPTLLWTDNYRLGVSEWTFADPEQVRAILADPQSAAARRELTAARLRRLITTAQTTRRLHWR